MNKARRYSFFIVYSVNDEAEGLNKEAFASLLNLSFSI
jgi:hypothetical protein